MAEGHEQAVHRKTNGYKHKKRFNLTHKNRNQIKNKSCHCYPLDRERSKDLTRINKNVE